MNIKKRVYLRWGCHHTINTELTNSVWNIVIEVALKKQVLFWGQILAYRENINNITKIIELCNIEHYPSW